jgi:NAD+ synthase/NAD+ synthase (glutamine-hydrolysing)
MRIALGQINTTIGDLDGNVNKMVEASRQASARGAQLVVFPELAITGYPPQDLLEKESFVCRNESSLERLAHLTSDLPLIVLCGYVSRATSRSGKRIANSAALLRGGKQIFRQDKMLLPTYDVFDEARYFVPAERQQLFPLNGQDAAITVCEDAWNDKQFWTRLHYRRDPVEELISAGARLLISINASPFHMGKRDLRHDVFASLARRHKIPVVYVNQVGGNDQLVFDGTSFVMNAEGRLIASAKSFGEDLVIADLDELTGDRNENLADSCEAVYEALVLGTRDYIQKCGFRKAIIGLSGGIDSALTAVIAAEAVGKDNVTGVAMPGPFSSEHSLTDAAALARNLGIRFECAPITAAFEQIRGSLRPILPAQGCEVAEENLQSRLRGMTLMALSNATGALVLTTGNKSELAVGYCTLYGDMCGGLAVISDVPKTLVYQLARLANRRHNGAIPENTFVKPPSAELRPDQKDSDSLPPYDVLDRVLRLYVEDFASVAEIVEKTGASEETVVDIVRKVDLAEYKRQQAAPGLKVTTKAFGIGRRFPIAQRFRE